MDAIIIMLTIPLIIAAWLVWFQTGRIVDLKSEKSRVERRLRLIKLIHARSESRAQAEIMALEDKLVRLECQNGLTPGVEP